MIRRYVSGEGKTIVTVLFGGADSSLHDSLHDLLQAGSNAVNATGVPDGKALKRRTQQGFPGA
jgi:hypothetical protein